jgi:hypothetical protein
VAGGSDGARAGRAVSAPALSAAAALAWLGSLSVDLRATAVLDASGAVLAGDAALGARAAEALAAAPEGAGEVRAGDLLAVRSARHAVAAALGPQALERLARADLLAALTALDGA